MCYAHVPFKKQKLDPTENVLLSNPSRIFLHNTYKQFGLKNNETQTLENLGFPEYTPAESSTPSSPLPTLKFPLVILYTLPYGGNIA